MADPPVDSAPNLIAEAGALPREPDELANFFGLEDSDGAGTAQILADVLDAKKDGATRRDEVNKAVADPENAMTKQGRELGGALAASLPVEVGLARVALVLGEATAERLKGIEVTDVSVVIRALGGELSELDGGQRDIFKNLPEEQILATVGVQRRADQQRVTVLKATLLGLSEGAFQTGDFVQGLSALQAARVNMVSAEPTWMVQSMAEAVEKADLENSDVREALVSVIETRVLGTTRDMEAEVVTKPVEELSWQEKILRKAVEARAINLRIEAEAQQAILKAEYDGRMKREWDRKMGLAVTDGRDSFHEHFRGGSNYVARFKVGEGSGGLADFCSDWSVSAEMTQSHQLGGISGYLQILENFMEPGNLDKVVARQAERTYSDLGGKSKRDYEQAGNAQEWDEHIRHQILTEIHGNALGILEGAIEWDDQFMTDQMRAQILRKSLEVLGHGQAIKFLAGEGELTPEQVLVRKSLFEYVKNPVAGQEKQASQDPDLITRRLARLKNLKDLAVQADIAVAQRIKEAAEAAQRDRDAQARREGELAKLVDISKEHLRVIEEETEKIRDTQAKGARIQEINQTANIEDYLRLDRRDSESMPRIDISIDRDKLDQANRQVKELKQALEADPHNRELRDKLATSEVDVRLFSELRDLVTFVNRDEFKRKFKKTGMFQKERGAISVDAFYKSPGAEDDIHWPSSKRDIDDSLQQLESASKPHESPTRMSLTDLRVQVATQEKDDTKQVIETDIRQTEKALGDRENEYRKLEKTFALRAERVTKGIARDIVKRRLNELLQSEFRISHSI